MYTLFIIYLGGELRDQNKWVIWWNNSAAAVRLNLPFITIKILGSCATATSKSRTSTHTSPSTKSGTNSSPIKNRGMMMLFGVHFFQINICSEGMMCGSYSSEHAVWPSMKECMSVPFLFIGECFRCK
jgi:hypothetical protein